jgi:hypothetical protein
MNGASSESWGCRGEEGDWTRGFIVRLGRTPLDTQLRMSFKIPRAAQSNSARSVEIVVPSAGRVNLATRSHAQARREISQAGSTLQRATAPGGRTDFGACFTEATMRVTRGNRRALLRKMPAGGAHASAS